MHAVAREPGTGSQPPRSRSHRPAVVEHVDSPRSTSDGRATIARDGVHPYRPQHLHRPHGPVDARPTFAPPSGAWPTAVRPGAAVPGHWRALGGQVARFAAIGVISTLAWAGLYLLLRGAGLGSVAANAVALVITAVGNTAANRRLTFGVSGRAGLVRDHGAGLLALVLALAITTSAANLLGLVAPHAGRLAEIVVLSAANIVATACRFTLLRAWLARPAATGAP